MTRSDVYDTLNYNPEKRKVYDGVIYMLYFKSYEASLFKQSVCHVKMSLFCLGKSLCERKRDLSFWNTDLM